MINLKNLNSDSPTHHSNSPTRRIGESPTLWLAKSGSRQLSDSASRRVGGSSIRWVVESATPRLAELKSQRLPDSPSRRVVFQVWISPHIWSQNRNGSKGSVRDLCWTDLCKKPRKSGLIAMSLYHSRNCTYELIFVSTLKENFSQCFTGNSVWGSISLRTSFQT